MGTPSFEIDGPPNDRPRVSPPIASGGSTIEPVEGQASSGSAGSMGSSGEQEDLPAMASAPSEDERGDDPSGLQHLKERPPETVAHRHGKTRESVGP